MDIVNGTEGGFLTVKYKAKLHYADNR